MSGVRAVEALVGESPGIREVRGLIEEIGPTQLNVLLEGPTGSGKELAAQALHAVSGRAGQLVALNVCAIPDAMFEDAFFGHVRGAFSGAVATHRGHLTEADRGTLFLDEIGALAAQHQVKLLRAIETRTYRPVGSASEIASSFRVVSAVNSCLSDLIANGQFRRDLAHRLAGARIRLPSLFERLEDLPALVASLLARIPAAARVSVASRAIDVLGDHSWPGNVRELRNVLERALAFSRGSTIERHDVRRALASGDGAEVNRVGAHAIEHRRLLEVIRGVDGNVREAARELGVHRATLYRRLRRLGVQPPSAIESDRDHRRSAGESAF